MGYELNKIMQMYGVKSPTIGTYAGAAYPTNAPSSTATQAEQDAFQESLRKYNVDKSLYDQYAQDYRARLASGNMYNQKQFGGTGVPSMPVLEPLKYTYGPSLPVSSGSSGTGTGTGGTGGTGGTTGPVTPPDYTNYYDNGYYNGYYAQGGKIRTHYAQGDAVKVSPDAAADDFKVPALTAPAPSSPAQSNNYANLLQMISNYSDNSYSQQLAQAQKTAKDESEAFYNMLNRSMSSPENASNSKAEMYFRLAAAFGSPTKTGKFAENLSLAGQQLADYAKQKRAESQSQLATQLKAQEMKMGAAKEELAGLKGLAAEEMRDRRALGVEMLKDYVASGKAQSTAGKQAQDEGLVPGTPEFTARVKAISDSNLEKTTAQINATLANLSAGQARLALEQNKMEFAQQQAEQKRADYTPYESKLLTQTEDQINNTYDTQQQLLRAMQLNKNAYAGGLNEAAEYWVKNKIGNTDPKVLNTSELENLLKTSAFSKLKATFPGAVSDSEREALLATVGIGSKSREERHRIMLNAYRALQAIDKRARDRIQRIQDRKYRTSSILDETPPEETLPPETP